MQQNFQVDLEGIIDLLSNHLYSSDQVFVRELLQNGVDAITARRQMDDDFLPRVEVSYIHGDDEAADNQVVFEDNGVGLTEEEVHDFLTKIGSSIKRQKSVDRSSFIGQFGIGLLSCFMVTKRIVMITQSVDTDYSLKWTGEANGTYHYELQAKRSSPGTSVYVVLNEEVKFDFPASKIKELLQYYGGLLAVPIYFSEDGNASERLNFQLNPMGQKFEDFEEEQKVLLDFGTEQFAENFLAAIPVRTAGGRTQGVAFIKRNAHLVQQQSNKVYLKQMLVADDIDNILPKWAFFIKAVFNTTSLQPTASRERFYQNEDLEKTRRQLGRAIRNQLMKWHRSQPILLKRVIEAHERSIKEMAEQDEAFLKIVLPYLTFPTTKGQLTLAEIRKHDAVIRYVYELEEYQQIRSLVGAQDLLIVKTRYGNDRNLFNEIKELYPDWEFRAVDVQELFHQFEELNAEECEAFEFFLDVAADELIKLKCDGMIRKFDPDHIPTVCYLSPEARWDRSSDLDSDNLPELWNQLYERFNTTSVSVLSRLCFNFNNPTIQRLSRLDDPKLLALYIRFLYFQAILLGNYALNKDELQLFGQGILAMIDLHEEK
ncbi:MAG: HSP90 family protein [Bacteroidota bacterium]